MNKLVNHLQRLFKKSRLVEKPQPILYQKFDWKSFDTTKSKDSLYELNEIIYSAYIDWKVSGNSIDERIRFFDNKKSRGFALSSNLVEQYHQVMGELLAYYIDLCSSYKYIANKSEISSQTSSFGLATIYHIYLKPSYKLNVGPKATQLFGNLEWKYKIENDKPLFLSMLAHTYSDHKFENAQPMSEMMEYLFKN